MKKILWLLCLLVSFTLNAQKKKFYKKENDEIITQQQYDELKKKVVIEFKNQLKQEIILKEVFGKREEKGDSIIINFSFKLIPAKGATLTKPDFSSHLIGKNLEDFTLESIDGTKLDVKELKGKPTLINFWFTTCKPCIEESPVLNRLRKEYGDKMNFIAVTFQNAEKVRSFLKKRKFNFNHYVNAQSFIDEVGIGSYPTSLFLDKEGIVRYTEGAIPLIGKDGKRVISDGKEFEELIKKLIQ